MSSFFLCSLIFCTLQIACQSENVSDPLWLGKKEGRNGGQQGRSWGTWDLGDVHMLLLGASDLHANILLLGICCVSYAHHAFLFLGATHPFLVEKLAVSTILLPQRVDIIHKGCLGACLFNILPFVSGNHQGSLYGRNPWCSSSSGPLLAVYYRQPRWRLWVLELSQLSSRLAEPKVAGRLIGEGKYLIGSSRWVCIFRNSPQRENPG